MKLLFENVYLMEIVFRFYLNPELAAVKTMSGNSALIQISKNKSLILDQKGREIANNVSGYVHQF